MDADRRRVRNWWKQVKENFEDMLNFDETLTEDEKIHIKGLISLANRKLERETKGGNDQ